MESGTGSVVNPNVDLAMHLIASSKKIDKKFP